MIQVMRGNEFMFTLAGGSPIEAILLSPFFKDMTIVHHTNYCEAIDGDTTYYLEKV